MINEEETKTVDQFKEVRCPICEALLFKKCNRNIKVKCRKCDKIIKVEM